MSKKTNKLQQSLKAIIRPIVKLMISHDIGIKVFLDSLKEVYVTTAEEILSEESDKVTDSHISLITGVHRKDVKTYRNKKYKTETAPLPLSVGAELIARWIASPLYSNEEGVPLPLPYNSDKEDNFSFMKLSENTSKDIRPRVLLDEFLRSDIVDYDRINNIVTLKTEAFIPNKTLEEKLYYFKRNSRDHLTAAVENILSQKPIFLERSVYHDGLTKESVAELKKASTSAAMRMLKLINKKSFELSEKDKGNPAAKYRINLGAYFFTDSKNDKKDEGLV